MMGEFRDAVEMLRKVATTDPIHATQLLDIAQLIENHLPALQQSTVVPFFAPADYNQSSIAMALVTDDFILKSANEAFYNLTLTSESDINGSNLLNFISPIVTSDFPKDLHQMPLPTFVGTITFNLKPNNNIYFLSAYPDFVDDKKIIKLVFYQADYFDAFANNNLLPANDGFKLLAELTNEVLLLFDDNVKVYYVSPSVTRKLGYTQHQVLNAEEPAYFIMPEDRSVLLSAILSKSNTINTFQIRVRHANHQIIWMEAAIRKLSHGPNRITGTVVYLHDISDKVNARNLLRIQNEQSRALLNLIPAVVYFKDLNLNYQVVNNHFLSWLGNLTDNPIGKTEYQFFNIDTARRLLDGDKEVVTAGVARVNEEFEFELLNGQKSWMSISRAPFFDGNGNILGLVGIVWDITPGKLREVNLTRSKNEVLEATMQKSYFLANLSHEIRTPMNGIIGMVDLLSQTEMPLEHVHYVKTLKESAEHLLIIVNDILDLSRLESGRILLEATNFKPVDVVHETLRVMNVTAKSKGLRINYNIDLDVPDTLIGDPTRVKQILYNIIGNAIKYTDEGHIALTIEREALTSNTENAKARLLFSIEDTGRGLTQKQIDAILNEYVPDYQPGDKPTFEGTGLGLAITRRLVGLMGGKLWIKSELSKGSTFFFSMVFDMPTPSEKPTDEPSTHIKQGIRLTPLNILLAEDSEVNQMVIKGYLSRRGHNLKIVNNGKEALNALTESHFDLVLMDIQMPVLDGLETTRIIRKHTDDGYNPNIPIIALTAYAVKGDRERFLEAGMNAYLPKPIQMAELFEVIEKIAIEYGLYDKEADSPTMAIKKMYTDFLTQEQVRLEKIKKGLLSADAETAISACFALRNSAVQVGALKISNQANRIERLINEGQISGAIALFSVLEREFEKLKQEVDAITDYLS